MRRRASVVAFLAAFWMAATGLSAATQGGIKGRALVNQHAISGIPLTLVNAATGQSFAVRTTGDGSYSVSVPSGAYVVSSPGARGLSIGGAPLLIRVSPGRFATADIEMVGAISQDIAGAEASIFHNPIGCVAKSQFPVFDTTFQPAESVVGARLYFKSNLSDEWFYTEFVPLSGTFPKYKWTMTADPANPASAVEGDDIRRRWTGFDEPVGIDPGVPPTHRAFLPQVQEGSGIEEVTYYIQVTLSNFTESRTREIPIRILAPGQSCKGGLFAAPVGAAPTQGVTVLASSGVAATPAGFASVGLSTVASATTVASQVVAAVASVAPVAGAGAAAVLTEGPASGSGGAPTAATPNPTPTSTATPTPSTTPTATPTPTPSPTPGPLVCQLTVLVTPSGGPTGPCQVTVSGAGPVPIPVTASQVFQSPCATPLTLSAAIIGPPASIIGPPTAVWTGACTGDALAAACVLPVTRPAVSSVSLTCR